MQSNFVGLNKLKPGDRVAVISPSAGLPELFPHVYELGLKRLTEEFRLTPIEYPTTRKMNSSFEDRARDIMAAFADPHNRAVFSTIGGYDQIRLVKLLKARIFRESPKPFFGFSDNTHLCNYLWSLGIPSFYGGAIMTQFGMQLAMHDFTKHFLRLALFEGGEVELHPASSFNDVNHDWAAPENLLKERQLEPNEGWIWDAGDDVEGILWGGCLESLDLQLKIHRHLPAPEQLHGTVLMLETSEAMPTPHEVMSFMVGMGEAGLLEKFAALLVGRPKAYDFKEPRESEARQRYRENQRATIRKFFREYNQKAPIVQNLDFGHSDPQICMPLGQKVRISSREKRIWARF